MSANPKPLVLWCCPRSVSSAFGVMMMQRGDLQVFHEPFGPAYYFGPDRSSRRKADAPVQAEHSYNAILARLEDAARAGPVFSKDMAYYIAPVMTAELIGRFQNTILIRNPKNQLRSLERAWPDFTLAEAGFIALDRLCSLMADSEGRPPAIIDADDLLDNPPGIVRAFCDHVGIPYKPEALNWEAQDRSEINWWEGGSWHGKLAESQGFNVTQETSPTDEGDGASDRYLKALAVCQPIYEQLFERRITAS